MGTEHRAGKRCAPWLLLAGWLIIGVPTPATLAAQDSPESQILTTVDPVTESTVFVAVGRDHGLTAGDTLSIAQDSTGQAIGALLVQSTSRKRSVATYLGKPFPVGGGAIFYARFRPRIPVPAPVRVASASGGSLTGSQTAPDGTGSHDGTPARGLAPAPEETLTQEEEAPSLSPTADGRIAFEMDGRRSVTKYGEDLRDEAERWFTTPTLRLNARVRDLPGGVQFNTNLRLAYRYSTADVVQPQLSGRVYQASIRKELDDVPLEIEAGRFYNRYDEFSGYFDGIMARVHSGPVGAGVAVGTEPNRANESVWLDLPKLTAFADVRASGERAGYDATVSFHTIRPRGDLLDRNFFGLSQRLSVGRARFFNRFQLDRDPETDKWIATQLRVDATIPISGQWYLRGGYGRRRPYSIYLTSDVISYTRERITGGIGYWGGTASVNLDVSANRGERDESSRTYSGSFAIPARRLGGLGVNGSFSYWERDDSNALHASPGVSYRFGQVRSRLGYRYYRTEIGGRTLKTHGGNMSLDFPVVERVHATLRAYTNWGEELTSTRLSAGFWMSF